MRWFWFDRYTEFVSGAHAVAVKCVSLAEEHLHDHFLGYPIMPNSLVIEGIAQAGGILVSEHYRFSELVVLGKVSKAVFHGRVLPGEQLTYRVKATALRPDGAGVSATAHVGDRLHAEAELFFARLGEDSPVANGARLFRPTDLRHWLNLVGVFDVGVDADGVRLRQADYPLSETD
ncbi:MAG: beta-hydroxyacyl-ACP dehydratase [Planctomycetales bacterium]|nr:beta-hydroxyacyl-ACP dehydratase [Planctomycetales bacterium]